MYKARDKTTDTIVAIKKVHEISLHFTSPALALYSMLRFNTKIYLFFSFRQIKVGHRTEAKDGKCLHSDDTHVMVLQSTVLLYLLMT